MENIKPDEAFYTTSGQSGVRYIAHGYDKMQPLAGPWVMRNTSKDPATREEIEAVLTAPAPRGQGYRSATYLEPDAFARVVLTEHKRVWLSVYKIWRDDLADARAKGKERRIPEDQESMEEALEKLRLYHGINQEQADQLLADPPATTTKRLPPEKE